VRVGVSKRVWNAALAGAALLPWAAHAQIATTGATPGQAAPTSAESPDPATETPIVPEAEFEASLPTLSEDPNAPLEPLADFDTAPAANPPETATDAANTAASETEIATPLPPIATFDATPVEVVGVDDEKPVELRYDTVVFGLDAIALESRFRDLSALEDGDGKAGNAAMVSARAKEDEGLAIRLMQSLGYYDGTAVSMIEQNPANSGRVKATITASPGNQYKLGSIAIVADPTVPAGLIDRELPLKVGDPIEADRIQGAEANVSLKLPQQGYPFVEVGQRDILLDEAAFTGAYTLPVTTGPRSSFGTISTEGELAFDVGHVGVLARFKNGELYDSRMVDDLREALVATSLFSTVSVEPQRTGQPGPDGTEAVNLLVRQDAGPPRTLAAEAGYGTGQGLRVEASWTHRNLFPPEGALIISGVAGTQEQGLGATFRRSNAGQRDRTFTLAAIANRSNYDAFEAFTGTLSARMSYDSTPIWQKKFTYGYGVELIGTNEDRYNFAAGARDRGTYFVAALPLFAGFDTSDDLLNPTRGYRIKANVSPEGSVNGGVRPYGRVMLEGTAYYPVTDSIVIAGRARVGSIQGIARDDLAPSRRYYAGGGGSVRGFGYQELGPRSPDGKPVGGRSFNEFAIEARYRFGDFGIVPFLDAGQVYDDTLPKGQDMRFGVGIGGRFYTNFGPLRVDVAMPLAKQPGESQVAVYISIGQAF
jgi:translocation and assembly module TamA